MTDLLTTPVILDGGMGRELQKIGAPFKQPEWSAQALMQGPHYISQVHDNFIDAGAQVITTNTYALVPFHIGEACFSSQGNALIELAAQLARKAVDKSTDAIVAGCIPPVLGSYRPDLFNVEQAQPLINAMIANQQQYVDIWLAETISSISEAILIKDLTAVTTIKTWIAFTINDQISERPTLRSGESVYDAACRVAGQHVTAILFNCSCSEVMEAALRSAKKALIDMKLINQVQLGVYANNFPPIGDLHQANDGVNVIRDDVPPTKYAQFATSWRAAGASIIGGCCGISPEHIKKLSEIK